MTDKDTAQNAHACDNPRLSGKEFLYAVMRDPALPITQRIKAAGKLMAIEPNGPPRPSLTIVIGAAEDPDGSNRDQQSFSPSRSNTHRPFPGGTGPSYIEKTLERMPLSEIIEIVSRTPEHLLPTCACGHKMFYPCSPPCSKALLH